MMAATEVTYRTGRYGANDPVSHIWEIRDDRGIIGGLYVSVDRGEISNIEVREGRRGEGIARRLYETAMAQMTIYHAPEGHRTPEGDAFALAVGGPTVEPYDCDCYACDLEED